MDADGSGQTNLFKYLTGLNPTDPSSRFRLSIQTAASQPGHAQLVLNPIATGRTSTVYYTNALTSGSWTALTGATRTDLGNQRTVIDPSSTSGRRFYRVLISMP